MAVNRNGGGKVQAWKTKNIFERTARWIVRKSNKNQFDCI